MGNKRRAAEANVGLFFNGVVQISLPIAAVGGESLPSEPQPEDEWRVPTEPIDAEDSVPVEPVGRDGAVLIETEDSVPVEPVGRDGAVVLQLQSTRKG